MIQLSLFKVRSFKIHFLKGLAAAVHRPVTNLHLHFVFILSVLE